MKGGQAGAFRTGQMGHEMRPIHCVRGESVGGGGVSSQRGSFRGLQVGGESSALFTVSQAAIDYPPPRHATNKRPITRKSGLQERVSCWCYIAVSAVAEEPNR